jgi:hypothetical protein
MQPALAWIHSASTQSLLYSSLFTAGSILRLNQCLSIAVTMLSASKYCAMRSRARHGALALLVWWQTGASSGAPRVKKLY